jgi:hypothetical protein
VALQGRERARLRVGVVEALRVGRDGLPLPPGREGDRAALDLPARGDAAVGQGVDEGHRADDEDLRPHGVRVPVPEGRQRARPGVRHGVPDDRLLRRAARAGRELHVAARVRARGRHDPRGGPQLVPDDRGQRRAEVDLYGRGPQQLPRVCRGSAGRRRTSSAT